MGRCLPLLLATLIMTLRAGASPFSDLASPSQEVRIHAAQTIRDNHLFKETSRKPWEAFASTFKPGDSAQRVLARLQKGGFLPGETEEEFGSRALVYHIPLDDCWALRLAINDRTLTELDVVEEPKEIWVAPPAGYSGFWRTYRINGERASFRYYVNGKSEIPSVHFIVGSSALTQL